MTHPTCVNMLKRPTVNPDLPPIQGFLAALAQLGGPRCGKPAAYETPLGPRCEDCIAGFREMARNPSTMINVLARRTPTDEEIERMIRPLKIEEQ